MTSRAPISPGASAALGSRPLPPLALPAAERSACGLSRAAIDHGAATLNRAGRDGGGWRVRRDHSRPTETCSAAGGRTNDPRANLAGPCQASVAVPDSGPANSAAPDGCRARSRSAGRGLAAAAAAGSARLPRCPKAPICRKQGAWCGSPLGSAPDRRRGLGRARRRGPGGTAENDRRGVADRRRCGRNCAVLSTGSPPTRWPPPARCCAWRSASRRRCCRRRLAGFALSTAGARGSRRVGDASAERRPAARARDAARRGARPRRRRPRRAGCGTGVVRGLIAAGLSRNVAAAGRRRRPAPDWRQQGPALSADQQAAARRLIERTGAGGFTVTVLDGVTGRARPRSISPHRRGARRRQAGTGAAAGDRPRRAMARALRRALRRAAGAMAFRSAMPSGATPGATLPRAGRAVVVGARSALFLPFPNSA